MLRRARDISKRLSSSVKPQQRTLTTTTAQTPQSWKRIFTSRNGLRLGTVLGLATIIGGGFALAQETPVSTKSWYFYSGKGQNLEDLRLFTGSAHRALAEEIAQFLGVAVSPAIVGRFSDGEIKIQVQENVRGKEVFIVQPVCNPVNDSLTELLLMISTMKRADASRITAVIPYYGYARQDRKLVGRVPISAADVALMLEAMGVDRVIAVDLHSGQIQGFFPPRIPVDNLASGPVGAIYFSEKELVNPVVVASDGSGVARAKGFLEVLAGQAYPNTSIAMLVEERATDEGGHMTEKNTVDLELVGDVKGSDCIIVEDIVDTGFTICRAAEELKKKGARRVFAFAPHGLFSGQANARIESSSLEQVVVTNTVPMSQETRNNPKVSQLTLAPLLAETIKRHYLHQSVTSLFQTPPKKTMMMMSTTTTAAPHVTTSQAKAAAVTAQATKPKPSG